MSSPDEVKVSSKFSLWRVLPIVIPIALLAWGVKAYSDRLEPQARDILENDTIVRLFGQGQDAGKLASFYSDANGDLVADTPTDATKLLKPTTLRFSYIAQSEDADVDATWKEFFEKIKEKTGIPVEMAHYENFDAQMEGLKNGELHITAVATGEVESAVNAAGFVPQACFANEAGDIGYKMLFIVPAESKITRIEDIKGKRLMLVRPKSNSGCIAPLVFLSSEHNMQLDKDFEFGMSQSHENSIRGIVTGQYNVAAVASDILERMKATDENVKADKYRIIYESKTYPPSAIGVPYNLDPTVADAVKEVLAGFDWKGTGLVKTYGGSGNTKFAVVSYKDDWQPVRDVQATASKIVANATLKKAAK